MAKKSKSYEGKVRELLKKRGPMPSLEPHKTYYRTQDDHDGTFEGKLITLLSPDGDMWLTTDKHHGELLRFRMPEFGGGGSRHTFAALRILALAIKLDNEERPERAPSRDE